MEVPDQDPEKRVDPGSEVGERAPEKLESLSSL